MRLIDTFPVRGSFSITSYNSKDEVIDSYEDKNLIMNKARSNMAELIGGHTVGVPINKFILGTKGHNPDTQNVLQPVVVGEHNFTSLRTELFSQAEIPGFYYSLSWDAENPVDVDFTTPLAWVDEPTFYELNSYARGNRYLNTGLDSQGDADPLEENTPCPINITITGNQTKYTITIPETAANGADSDSIVAYTEACLVAGDDIFSMKTMPARVKENTVRLVIEWTIIF